MPPDALYPDDPSLGGLQNIFNRRCLGTCHAGPEPDGKLSLEASFAYPQLVGIGTEAYCGSEGVRVVAGDPEASCLWTLISVDTMPLLRAPLSADQKQMVYNWIASGAPP